jgi:hypothetical protein
MGTLKAARTSKTKEKTSKIVPSMAEPPKSLDAPRKPASEQKKPAPRPISDEEIRHWLKEHGGK